MFLQYNSIVESLSNQAKPIVYWYEQLLDNSPRK